MYSPSSIHFVHLGWNYGFLRCQFIRRYIPSTNKPRANPPSINTVKVRKPTRSPQPDISLLEYRNISPKPMMMPMVVMNHTIRAPIQPNPLIITETTKAKRANRKRMIISVFCPSMANRFSTSMSHNISPYAAIQINQCLLFAGGINAISSHLSLNLEYSLLPHLHSIR